MLSWGSANGSPTPLVELYQDYRRSGTDGYAAQVHGTVLKVTGARPRALDQALAG
jgi:hypothetical protein